MAPHITNIMSTQASTALPQMDGLMLFGFLAAIATLACYASRHQSWSVVVVLAMCLAADAVYGFLQGAWPLGLIQGVGSVMTLQRWYSKKNIGKHNNRSSLIAADSSHHPWESESRVSRLFGPSQY
jgi:hypothetical protein